MCSKIENRNLFFVNKLQYEFFNHEPKPNNIEEPF